MNKEAGTPCTRCGECCRKVDGNMCDLRAWWTGERGEFTPPCDQLVEQDDGTTLCLVIADAFNPTRTWHEPTRQWIIEEFVGRGCERDRLNMQPKNTTK